MEELILAFVVISIAILANVFWYKKIDSKTWVVYGIYSLIIVILFLCILIGK